MGTHNLPVEFVLCFIKNESIVLITSAFSFASQVTFFSEILLWMQLNTFQVVCLSLLLSTGLYRIITDTRFVLQR